jgi:phenylalanyl-tRNA synthetase beta chain
MRISTQWLNEYVETPAPEELEHIFELAGIGVENYDPEGGVWTLEITSNRGDWLSAVGLAREVSAMTGALLQVDEPRLTEGEAPNTAAIEIENADDCARYAARVIENIQIGPSPAWMQQRLTEAGMRPINNVVDVTNYVMLEWGQPLHAFDADKLRGAIRVRRAQSGEKFTTLDGALRELSDDVLLITDARGPIAIAGIMGGQESEVTDSTTRILLEIAHFAPLRVRRGVRALNMRSEASRRFERWVDPNNIPLVANRAAQLLAECCGGSVAKGLADVYPRTVAPAQVDVRFARCRAILGLNLSEIEIVTALQRLGFTVENAGDVARVTVPTWRRDIEREIDLIEEVARIHGYEKIPTTLPGAVVSGAGLNAAQRLEQAARTALLGCGLNEIITYSLENSVAVERANLGDAPPHVTLRNPHSEDYTQLRTSLFPSLLTVLSNNSRTRARLFEIGKVFHSNGATQPNEPVKIGIALLEAPAEPHWQKQTPPADFYALKATVEALLSALGAAGGEYRPARHPSLHPGRAAEVFLHGEKLGVLGEVHPAVRENYDLKPRAVIAELDWATLARHVPPSRTATPISRFPASDRDLALLLNNDVPAARLESVAKNAGGELLESVRVFDVYTGTGIPEGQKSVAISLRFRAPERTLTEDEVEAAMQNIRAATQTELAAQLRS